MNLKVVVTIVVLLASACGAHFETWESEGCCAGDFGDRVRVMTLNIAHGRGTAFHQAGVPHALVRRNLARIAEAVRDEDVELAGLQEADRHDLDGVNHIAMIADLGGFEWWVSGAHTRIGTTQYGTALTGRSPLASAATYRFRTFGPGFKKGYSVSTVRLGEVEVDVVSLHLDPLLGVRRQQQVNQIVEDLADRDRPAIVMGDFNSQWGDDKPVTRMADELGLMAYRPRDELPTFGNRRLDWILVSEDVLDFEDYRTLPYDLSDHRGVVADIVLR